MIHNGRKPIDVVCNAEDDQRIREIGPEAFVRECEAGLWPPPDPSDLNGDDADQWPDPPKREVYHGILGEAVDIIAPHTEADPMAVLGSLMVSFGALVGRAAFSRAEADKHYPNLFLTTVGLSSKGRKGTALGQSNRLMRLVYERFDNLICSGLSSGEGVIWATRDPIVKLKTIRGKKGEPDRQETEIIDDGVVDKRLIVQETEFAGALAAISREKNTLSSIIRQAWDTGHLRQLVKNNQAVATDAHVTILAHITKPELRKLLTGNDIANGFANRFLWICTQRSKCLPEGGHLRDEALEEIAVKIVTALQFSQSVSYAIKRDDDARELWAEVYPKLSEGKAGLFGSATSRAEAQVLRLSLIYALADQSYYIRPVHLQAALAFWEYAEASARFIFGSALGDQTADTLLDLLKSAQPDGLTRAEMSAAFGRNKPAAEISRALGVLRQHGLARQGYRETSGRPAEVWHVAALPTSVNGLPFAN